MGVIPEDPDRVSTIGERGKRVWLYPQWVRGRFLTWRTAAHAFLIAMLLVGPWIDVAGNPAIRVDIPGRRIYFWGLTLFATDGAYLLFLAGFVVFSVFLFTALFGRAWCGWACPQTVFLESLIRPIERLIEGPAGKRRKRDNGPWNADRVLRKVAKLAAYLAVSGAIGTTFVAYFLGSEGVIEAQLDPVSHPAGTGTFLFITAATFFDFAYFREQTCIVVCPYGRFQSVLLDPDSLTVGYDAARGEPRGKKGTEGAGDCVDCKKCLHVCPTGIDIRKGAQMECVQCMACIDACDDVMTRLVRPQGLIRFTSENALKGAKQRIVRPRVIAYSVGLLAVLLAMSFAVSNRKPVELRLVKQGSVPFMELPDGRVQNALRLRIANKTDETRSFEVEVLAPESGEVLTPVSPFSVSGGKVENMTLFLIVPGDGANGTVTDFTIMVRDDQGFEQQMTTPFVTRSFKTTHRRQKRQGETS